MRTASLAVENGYQNVYVYRGGLPDWIAHGYPTESDVTYPQVAVESVTGEKLKEMIDGGEDLLVVDVRDAADFSAGRITVAVNVALDDLHERWTELPKDRKIVLNDRHGKQIRNAVRYLSYQGLTNLLVLEKGFVDSWKVHGYPVRTD